MYHVCTLHSTICINLSLIMYRTTLHIFLYANYKLHELLFGRAPTIAIHGVSNYAREGAPEPETVTVAKITRPGTPETASPAVEGPNKTKIEQEDTETRHPGGYVYSFGYSDCSSILV